MLLARRDKESKQRKSNERPLQVAHHDTRYLTLPTLTFFLVKKNTSEEKAM